jgi:hypothetical protein
MRHLSYGISNNKIKQLTSKQIAQNKTTYQRADSTKSYCKHSTSCASDPQCYELY